MTEFTARDEMENNRAGNQISVAVRRIGTTAAILGAAVLLLLLSTSAVFADVEHASEKVIAHGGGSYHGYETTNSVEAVNQAIANGYKLIELDMELSLDNKIIMIHDWDRTTMYYYGRTFPKKLTQRQFAKLSVYGKLQVLDTGKLASILEKHKDVRIITDTKGDNLELLTAVKENYPDLVSRFVPQIYDYDEWDEVRNLGYKDVILTLYAMSDPDMGKVASFAKEHGIDAVTMPDYMADKGYCRQLSANGIIVYVHPVSDYKDALKYMKQGAYGVYTGSLLPEEFAGIEKDHYLIVSKSDGSFDKLTDERIDGWKDLKIFGLNQGETALYYIDQAARCANEETFASIDAR